MSSIQIPPPIETQTVSYSEYNREHIEMLLMYRATLLIESLVTVVRVTCWYCGTVIVGEWSTDCQYISAHCYQYVR